MLTTQRHPWGADGRVVPLAPSSSLSIQPEEPRGFTQRWGAQGHTEPALDHVAAARRWGAGEPGSSRVHPVSPARTSEIISTWARGERGGEGDGCQRAAAVQIPPDSSPAAPALPVIPQNKLQSKQGARDGAVAATLSSFMSIFLPPPPARPEPLLFDSIYASCPERDLQGRCLSKAQES